MSFILAPTVWGQHRLEWGRHTHVMGIINVTPDSFSGDGLRKDRLSEDELIERTIAQARHFVDEGATLIDVGGESTRPQATAPLPVEEELARVIPVIQALRKTLPHTTIISIDTYKAHVAREALEAGADMLNDIWALRHDPEMAEVAVQYKVPIILMANMRGFQKRDIVSDIVRFLAESIEKALRAGIAWEHIIVDPGIGFGTVPEETLLLLRHLGALRALGRPILLGTSRKSTIGRVLGLPPEERLEGTAATVALGIAQGIDMVRVHDVREMMRVVKMSDAIVRGTFELSS